MDLGFRKVIDFFKKVWVKISGFFKKFHRFFQLIGKIWAIFKIILTALGFVFFCMILLYCYRTLKHIVPEPSLVPIDKLFEKRKKKSTKSAAARRKIIQARESPIDSFV